MRNLRNKTKDQGGFTLIEMLVVVAIIAILVAVSIPMINSALEKARNATDAANERAAKAEASIAYLTEKLPTQLDDDGNSTGRPITTTETCLYDAVNGKLVKESESNNVIPYGKCNGSTVNGKTIGPHKDGIIRVKVKAKTGEVILEWVIMGKGVLTGLHNSVVDG